MFSFVFLNYLLGKMAPTHHWRFVYNPSFGFFIYFLNYQKYFRLRNYNYESQVWDYKTAWLSYIIRYIKQSGGNIFISFYGLSLNGGESLVTTVFYLIYLITYSIHLFFNENPMKFSSIWSIFSSECIWKIQIIAFTTYVLSTVLWLSYISLTTRLR